MDNFFAGTKLLDGDSAWLWVLRCAFSSFHQVPTHIQSEQKIYFPGW